jgi:hypothetical protein
MSSSPTEKRPWGGFPYPWPAPYPQPPGEWQKCFVCHGTGIVVCGECSGTGKVPKDTGPIDPGLDGIAPGEPIVEMVTCPSCNGGRTEGCGWCGGNGYTPMG